MGEDKQKYLQAFKDGNMDFDGRVFVGVSSTGIYCRPICWAKQPIAENCTFYQGAAAAEKAGYRPCLLCRPELAPRVEGEITPTSRVAQFLNANLHDPQCLDKALARINVDHQALGNLFFDVYQVSPEEYLETARLHQAKMLLTDTELSLEIIAKTVGYSDGAALTDIFKGKYRLDPIRLKRKKVKAGVDHISITIGLRPPYRWEDMLGFLAMRAIPGVEMVKGKAYYRTVHLINIDGGEHYGWLKVQPGTKEYYLSLTLSNSLIPVLPLVMSRVRHLFDTNCRPDMINSALESLGMLGDKYFTPGTRCRDVLMSLKWR